MKAGGNFFAVCIFLVLLFSDYRVAAQGSFARAQGEVEFLTYEPPQVDAQVTFPDGTPVGAGFSAQLYGGPEGTPTSSLQPLLPKTTFFLDFPGYVNPVLIVLPNIPAYRRGTFFMRAFDGLDWESSSRRGESFPVTIAVGGDTQPGALLTGLQGFQVQLVPEPRTFTLLFLGFACRIFRRYWWKK